MVFSEDNLRKKIYTEIENDSRLKQSDIRVQMQGCRVLLMGTVPDFPASEAVNERVRKIRGVCSVESRLSVELPVLEENPTDEEIRRNIRSLFDHNSELNGKDFVIYVRQGHVTLWGTVNALWKKVVAGVLASRVKGVHKIRNELHVAPAHDVEDGIILKDIRRLLEQSSWIDASSVHVEVHRGHVTLSGRISSWSAYEAASSAALYTFGVKSVTNNLRLT